MACSYGLWSPWRCSTLRWKSPRATWPQQTCLEQEAAADDVQVPSNPHYSMILIAKRTKNLLECQRLELGMRRKRMHTGMLLYQRKQTINHGDLLRAVRRTSSLSKPMLMGSNLICYRDCKIHFKRKSFADTNRSQWCSAHGHTQHPEALSRAWTKPLNLILRQCLASKWLIRSRWRATVERWWVKC